MRRTLIHVYLGMVGVLWVAFLVWLAFVGENLHGIGVVFAALIGLLLAGAALLTGAILRRERSR